MAEWAEIDTADVADRSGVIDALFHRSLDGVTLSGLFTKDECAQAVDALEHRRATALDSMFGRMLGIPLAQLAAHVPDPNDRTLYYDSAAVTREALVRAFGFDPQVRVFHALSTMSGQLDVLTPSESGRTYATGNLRWFEAGGGLPAHVDNEFEAYRDGTMAHLQTLAETDGHLSWFVVLQAPSDGGALAVYEQVYPEHVPAEVEWNHRGRDDADFERLQAHRVAPPVGSMVVFGGGWRWHRIDPVGPGRDRITFGGFAGDGHDGRSLYVWF